jgi:hypothetical protein
MLADNPQFFKCIESIGIIIFGMVIALSYIDINSDLPFDLHNNRGIIRIAVEDG